MLFYMKDYAALCRGSDKVKLQLEDNLFLIVSNKYISNG